jgi:pimeloyl-ACP methyl ester carboxylesterase
MHWKELLTRLSYELINPTLPAEEHLKGIIAPTLIIWGDRDQFLPVEVALALYRLLPDAQLAVVPGADHFVTRTKVPLFAGLLKAFLLSH